MCGLVGAIGNITIKEENIVKQLLIVDSLRGVDSTGIACIHKNGEVNLAKQVGHVYDFLDSHKYTNAMKGAFRAIIGHNRWGTMGKATNRNAHPFEFDNLVGAHNGTLASKWRFDNHMQHDVDSAAMYAHMDKNGLRNTMTKMEGAWALTWWDKEDETMNFLRNKERPLWMCYTRDGKTLFWASESWMLHGCLGRNGVEYGPLIALDEDKHMSIAVSNTGALEKPHMVAMPADVKPVYFTQSRHLPETEKKTENLPVVVQNQSQVTHVRPGYENSKKVTFEVLQVRKDKFGANYLDLMDRNARAIKVRWYFHSHKVNPLDYVGEEIIADVKGMKTVPGEGTYYKIDTNSIVAIPPVGAQEEENNDEVFQGGDGQFYDLKGWTKKWGCCNWCSQNIHPHQKHSFDTQRYSYCADCTEDPEVTQYLNMTVVEASSPF